MGSAGFRSKEERVVLVENLVVAKKIGGGGGQIRMTSRA